MTHWTLVRSSLVSADKMVIRYSLPLSNSTNKIQQEKLGGMKGLERRKLMEYFILQQAGELSPSNLTTRRFTSWALRRAWSISAPRSSPRRHGCIVILYILTRNPYLSPQGSTPKSKTFYKTPLHCRYISNSIDPHL